MIVYKFGARPPTENAELIDHQLFLAHRYKNALTEVELGRRGATKAIEDADPTVQAAEAAIKALPEKATEKDRKAAFKALYAACKAAREAHAEELAAINESATAFRTALRTTYRGKGLYWGTYLITEAASDASRQGQDDPCFHRFDGTGRIGVQIQSPNTLTVEELWAGKDTRLRLTRAEDPEKMHPGSRRSGKKALVHLRVGSTKARKPVWASWPVTVHRSFPPGATVQWAWMQKRRIGPDYYWELCLTLKPVAGTTLSDAAPTRTGTVAVDLGWRTKEGGLRAGYWRDTTGAHGEFLIPSVIPDKLEHAHSIKSIRDRAFDTFRDALVVWIDSQDKASLPEWFVEATTTLGSWKSANRLSNLAWRWKKSRFDADQEFYPRVEAWRIQDRHLYKWEAHETEKTLRRRDEQYKIWAAHLARTYSTVVIEKFHLPDVAGRRGLKKNASKADRVKADNSSSRRHVVAPGTFRDAIENACSTRNTTVMAVPAEWTTIDCATCGKRIPWDTAPKVDHICEACKTPWDQDHQACVNLLARHAKGEGTRKGAPTGEKSKRQQRFGKRKDRLPKVREVGHTLPRLDVIGTSGIPQGFPEVSAQGIET